MTAVAQNSDLAGIEAEKLRRMYRQMMTIRLFEEQVNDLYTRALMPGLAHLSAVSPIVSYPSVASLPYVL